MKRERQIDVYYVIFPKEQNKILGTVFDTVDILKGTTVMAFILFMLVFRIVGVSGTSMCNTLQNNDKLMLSPITTTIKRGDIVVITQPWEDDKPIIKRVIGMAGDEININFDTGEVFLNGEVLDEPYTMDYETSKNNTFLPEGTQFPLVVPKGKVFVMGDNRNNSRDSRSDSIGCIDENYLLGRAFYRISPNRGPIGKEN